jgi:hypothetical protein
MYRERATELVAVAAGKFAFPGSYPLVAIMEDGETMCCDCVGKESATIIEAYPRDGWRIAGVGVHWEGDPHICAHCGASIESAYGPTDEGSAS